MTIDMNNFIQRTPLFSTDDGYLVARRKLQEIITPQREITQFNSPMSMVHNYWGNCHLPCSSPTNSIEFGFGSTRSSGSTSPF